MSEELRFICQGCQKEYSTDELNYSYINERYYCPVKHCTYAIFEIKKSEEDKP